MNQDFAGVAAGAEVIASKPQPHAHQRAVQRRAADQKCVVAAVELPATQKQADGRPPVRHAGVADGAEVGVDRQNDGPRRKIVAAEMEVESPISAAMIDQGAEAQTGAEGGIAAPAGAQDEIEVSNRQLIASAAGQTFVEIVP